MDPIRGFEALRELYDGLLDRFRAGPFSEGGDNVAPGLEVALPVGLGTTSLLTRRLGITLFLMPRPVTVSPLSGSLIGCCIALPCFNIEKLDSISLRNGVKFESH